MMIAEDVVWVLDLLARTGLHCWIDGGWGVDALLGEQTRDHDDLDIALEYRNLARFAAAAGHAGFREVYRDGPFNPTFADANDRRIDVHLVDTSVETVDEQGRRIYGGNGLPFEVGALAGTGEILGIRVRCCTAEFQMHSHTGYEFDDNDRRDLMALRHRFRIELPPEYGEADGDPSTR